MDLMNSSAYGAASLGSQPLGLDSMPSFTKNAALAVLDEYFKLGYELDQNDHVQADVALRYLEMLEKFRR